MNGFTLPTGYFWYKNLCKCGHDLQSHTVLGTPPTTPGNCRECVRQAGVFNQHWFESNKQPWPTFSFLPNKPPFYYTSGGLGFQVELTTGTPNPIGTTTVSIVGSLANIIPGMTFQVVAVNSANSTEYQVLNVDHVGNTVGIAPPGLLFNSPSLPVLFNGFQGSQMGPGLPPNGQRAG